MNQNLGFGPAAIRAAHLQEWLRLMQIILRQNIQRLAQLHGSVPTVEIMA